MIDELLKYQEADGKLRAIEQEIASTDERKKYMTARKFLEKAPEKLSALDARATEFRHLFEQLEKKYSEIADTIKDYENLDEMVDEQGGDITFYKKNASQIADSLKRICGGEKADDRHAAPVQGVQGKIRKDQRIARGGRCGGGKRTERTCRSRSC